MSEAQKALDHDIKSGIAGHFTAFQTTDCETGALIGPWMAMLHEPEMGGPLWALSKAVAAAPAVPSTAREIAILVVVTHFHAAYARYAHTAMARTVGLSAERIAMISSGSRPSDLSAAEGAAFEVATALVRGSPLPEECYRRTVKALGQHGANELFYLVGLYCSVSVLLNAYAVPVPTSA
jgi:alkylhydroperoxidase family enzyme